MMFFDENRARSIAAAARPVDNILGSVPEPGMFAGALEEIPRGVNRGMAQFEGLLSSGAADVFQPVYDGMEAVTGVKPLNVFSEWREAADREADRYAPDPLTTGTAGQIINGVTGAITQTAAGVMATLATGGLAGDVMLAGASSVGLSQGRQTFRDLRKEGVDPSTAVNAGFVTAVTTGAGALLPMSIGYSQTAQGLASVGLLTSQLPKSVYLAANIAGGGAANAAIGIVQRGATADALRAGGYDTMAKQYAPMDDAALASDFILGGVFSGAGALAGLPWSAGRTVDAAMLARDARHAKVGTAPGVPVDPASADAHARALDQAVRDTWEGRTVDVSRTGVDDAAFMPHPERDTSVADAARAEYETQGFQWRMGQRPGLFERPDISVTVVRGDEFGADRQAIRQGAMDRLNEIRRGDQPLTNSDTGWRLDIGKKDWLKMAQSEHQSTPELQAIASLSEIVDRAVLAESHPDGKRANADVQGIHRLYAPVEIDGMPYRAKLTVKDYKGKASGEKTNLHALEAVEIENAPPGTFPTYQPLEAGRTDQPTTGRAISIADLLRDSTREGGAIWERPGSAPRPVAGGEPGPGAGALPGGEAESGARGSPRPEASPAARDDIETQAGLALLEERGNIVLPTLDENGNEVQLSLRDALRDASAELEYAKPETFAAAVACQMKHGGV
ncbi:Large polyvalent protein-associated domain 3 [compost metagenome]